MGLKPGNREATDDDVADVIRAYLTDDDSSPMRVAGVVQRLIRNGIPPIPVEPPKPLTLDERIKYGPAWFSLHFDDGTSVSIDTSHPGMADCKIHRALKEAVAAATDDAEKWWTEICAVLDEVRRGWRGADNSNLSAALATIRKLAAEQPAGAAVPVSDDQWSALLKLIPEECRIVSREGGGMENIEGTATLSVARLASDYRRMKLDSENVARVMTKIADFADGLKVG